MIKISNEKWNSIHSDYKGIWEGKRSVLSGCISDDMSGILVEGIDFIIEDEVLEMNKTDLENVKKILNNADRVINVYENNKQEEEEITEFDLVDLIINMSTIIKLQLLKEDK